MRTYFIIAVILAPFFVRAQDNTGKDWYHFSADGKECVITKYDLPTPWLNRLSNDVFSAWITHDGFVESYLIDPAWNGLTNPQKSSGRFYIRDKSDGSFFLINKPSGNSKWESTVGLGYNTIKNTVKNISASVTYFIPRNDDVLLMTVEVENNSNEEKNIDVFGQVEFNLGDEVKSFILHGDGRGGSQFNLYKKVVMKDNVLLATQRTWRSTGSCFPWPYTGFFSVNTPVASYETIKEKFLGSATNEDQPAEVIEGKGSNTYFWSEPEYPWGVLQTGISLKAHEKKSVVFSLGMTRAENTSIALAKKYSDVNTVMNEFNNLGKYYDAFINNSVVINTPDKENDRIINIWSKYMWRQFYKKSLNNGAYGLGLWSYGIEGGSISVTPEQFLMPFDMDILGNSVRNMLSLQTDDTTQTDIFDAGLPGMLYEDLEMKGPPTAVHSQFKVPHHHNVYGFLFSLYFYLYETGDFNFLNEKIPYIGGNNATVWEHIRTALYIATKGIDERGLPKIPANVGDWMDEFTRVSEHGDAESQMLAAEIGLALKGFSEMALKRNAAEDAKKWMAAYDKMKSAVEGICWDGKWYKAAFSDRINPRPVIGTAENKEGKIYLNSQAWPILAGMASKEHADAALNSVRKELFSEYGPMVFAPSYSEYVDYVGTQSIYAPGFRNSCIYLRPVGWTIVAACLNGDAKLANEMYNSASLVNQCKNMPRFRSEPYAYPENYNGPGHRLSGKGEFQWNLGEGTAWMWASYVNYILGVRPELDGLLIDPKIPSQWDGYSVKRVFRGNTFNIEVKNPRHVSSGVKSITINGSKIKGNILSVKGKNNNYNVIVNM